MTVRWGIIGCGDIARKRVAAAIREDPRSELLAACRRDEAKLQDFCAAFDVPRAYRSAEEVIADNEVNAVYIATPVNEHRSQTIAAAQAGKHVLCEKPMALNADECDAMIAACHRHGVRLGVAYYRRFYPVVLRMKELIALGAIGTPLSVQAVCATAMDMAPGEDGYWRVIPAAGGGGALMDVGSHRINLMLDMFGEIARIKSLCSTVAADYQAENVAAALFQFSAGMQGTLTCLFNTPIDPDRFEVIGTRGRLLSSPLNGGELLIAGADGQQTESLSPHDNFHSPLIADFTASLAQQRTPTIPGEEGRATTAVMDRIYADAASGSGC